MTQDQFEGRPFLAIDGNTLFFDQTREAMELAEKLQRDRIVEFIRNVHIPRLWDQAGVNALLKLADIIENNELGEEG